MGGTPCSFSCRNRRTADGGCSGDARQSRRPTETVSAGDFDADDVFGDLLPRLGPKPLGTKNTEPASLDQGGGFCVFNPKEDQSAQAFEGV